MRRAVIGSELFLCFKDLKVKLALSSALPKILERSGPCLTSFRYEPGITFFSTLTFVPPGICTVISPGSIGTVG